MEDVTDVLRVLEQNKITGKVFLELTDEDLREMVKAIEDRKALKRLADSYKPQPVVRKPRAFFTWCLFTCMKPDQQV